MSNLTLESNSNITTLYKYLLTSSIVTSFCIPRNVMSIESGVFEGAYSLTTITVEEGNKNFTISQNGLMNYEKTLFVAFPLGRKGEYSIPSGTKMIYTQAFFGSKITSITFPDTLEKIDGFTFSWSDQLTEVIIPDSVTYIGQYAFNGCSKLQKVKLSSNCQIIDQYSFNGCSISSITVPEGVITLGTGSFSGNSKLKEVILPSTIENIGGNVFPNNPNISISFGSNSNLKISTNLIIMDKNETAIIQYMGSDDNFSPTIEKTIKTINVEAFISKSNLVSVVFPEDSALKTIENKAFYDCKNLKSINFPKGLLSIGDNSFYNCKSLTKIEFQSSLTKIGESCFERCTSIETVDLSVTGLTTISKYSFSGCFCLKTVSFPINNIFFESYCFFNCYSLTSLIVPKEAGICRISEYAFYNTSIESFNFTETSTTTTIDRYAFGNCTNLRSFDFRDPLQTVGTYAFASSGITEVKLSNGISLLKDRCFYECASLNLFEIPENSRLTVNGLEEGAFGSCASFSTIVCNSTNFLMLNKALFSPDAAKLILFPSASKIMYFPVPESTKTIGSGSFIGCTNLISVIFSHDSVTSIGNNAFEGCINLHYINIPESITTVGEDAFKGCKSLVCGVDIESNDKTFIRSLVSKSKLPMKALKKCGDVSCKLIRSKSKSITPLTVFVILFAY